LDAFIGPGPAIRNVNVPLDAPDRPWVGLSAAAAAAGVTERELLMRYLLASSQTTLSPDIPVPTSSRVPAFDAEIGSNHLEEPSAAVPPVTTSPATAAGHHVSATRRRWGEATEICQSLLSNLRLILPAAVQDICS
jgi:hypothetical protein